MNEAINRASSESDLYHICVSYIELLGCVKILLNYRDQTQRCNSRLDLFESQQHASTSIGSNSDYELSAVPPMAWAG